MPRLSRDLVEARESFATQQAKEGKSAEEIQKLLVEVGPGGKTGMRMFVPRLEALIKEATGGLPSTIRTASVPTHTDKPKAVHKPISEPPKPMTTRVEKCAVDYGGKDCGNEVTVYEGQSQGKNLPVCTTCKKSGVMAVVRRVA